MTDAKQQRLAEAFGTTHATFTTAESNFTPERATLDARGLGGDDTNDTGTGSTA